MDPKVVTRVPSSADEAFDYYETLVLCCSVPGCVWTSLSSWAELGNDGDAHEVHRQHWAAEHEA